VEVQKIFVNPEDNKAVLKCPHCSATKTRHVGKFKGGKRRIKIRCACQSVFAVLFEFRKAPRKEVDLRGKYAKLPEDEGWRDMLVTNVSAAGMGLLLQSTHNLRKGDKLKVRFKLDDRGRSMVEKKAVVRWVAAIHVGCEFTQSVDYGDEALSSYLAP
jgi:hypothetical protein